MAVAWMSRGGRRFRVALGEQRARLASRRHTKEAIRLLGLGRLDRVAAGRTTGRRVSETDLHAYIDGRLAVPDQIDVEAFLAAHPAIASRVESYRSELIAVNAAFRGSETELPPPLARLACRYASAVRSSALAAGALGIAGAIAILCTMAGAALGAAG